MHDVSLDELRLFLWPLASALLTGLVCPAIGVWLYLRRTSFLGIVLPQFAAAGVVTSYAVLPWWIVTIGLGGLTLDEALGDPHAASTFSLVWAALFTLAGLALLVGVRRQDGSPVARAAAGFAIASALVLVVGRISPLGTGQVEALLQGEVLGVGVHDFEMLAVVLGLASLLLAWFAHDLLLVSYDRDTALVLGKRAARFEVLLHLGTGLVVAAGTLTVGPVLLFGLLVVPPLAARPWARSMRSFHALAIGLGAAAALLGGWASLAFDLPLGAAVVAASALSFVPRIWKR